MKLDWSDGSDKKRKKEGIIINGDVKFIIMMTAKIWYVKVIENLMMHTKTHTQNTRESEQRVQIIVSLEQGNKTKCELWKDESVDIVGFLVTG